MNKLNRLFGGLLAMILLSLMLASIINQKKNIVTAAVDDEEIVLEFAAISDIHLKNYDSIEQTRFESALKLSYQNTSNLDAVVINGDFTDGGHDPQYASFLSILDEQVTDDTDVIVNLGNHENGRNESDSHDFFRKTMGYDIDAVFNVNGYYFITLGVHYGDIYSESQAVWLQNQLEAITAENSEQPVFVLIHYPAYQTTTNSTGNGRLTYKYVLEQFPQVIHISGHSHPALQDPRTIHQDKFTSFTNSSLSYLFYEKADFNGPEDTASVGQFAIFKVTDQNKVIIERHVISDEDINDSIKMDEDYIIDIPKGIDGFTYTTGWYDDGTNPYFSEDAQISLTKEVDNWQISFDQASDQRLVYYYHIYIKEISSGEVVKVLRPNSKFYMINPPEILTRDFSANLSQGSTYEVSIYAVSVTNRTSAPLTQSITIE